MNVRHLIWVSILGFTLLVGICSFTGYKTASQITERLGTLTSPGAVLAAQIEWQQQVMLVQQLENSRLTANSLFEQISLSGERESTALETVIMANQVAADLSNQLDNRLKEFHQNRARLISDLQQNLTPDYAAFYQSANELLGVGNYLISQRTKNQALAKKINQLLDDASTQLIFIFIFSLVMAAILLMLFYSSLLIPLANINGNLRGLATQASNLRLRLPEGNTEVGQLGASINRFLQQLQTLFLELQSNTQTLMLASSQISDSVNKSASSSGDQITAIGCIATALQKLSDSLEGVGEFAGRANQASGSAIDRTKSGSHIVVRVEQAIDQIANEVERATQVVMNLLDESQQISLLREQVSQIAEQTNQLATTAAIETTRARDPGRLLAPVVENLRMLALRAEGTARSADANITHLSQTSAYAAEVMSAAQKRSGILKDRILKASHELSNIVTAVDQIKITSLDIARMSSDEKAEMATINKNVLNILQLARRNYTAGTAATKSRQFLEQHLLKMNSLLQRFRT